MSTPRRKHKRAKARAIGIKPPDPSPPVPAAYAGEKTIKCPHCKQTSFTRRQAHEMCDGGTHICCDCGAMIGSLPFRNQFWAGLAGNLMWILPVIAVRFSRYMGYEESNVPVFIAMFAALPLARWLDRRWAGPLFTVFAPDSSTNEKPVRCAYSWEIPLKFRKRPKHRKRK